MTEILRLCFPTAWVQGRGLQGQRGRGGYDGNHAGSGTAPLEMAVQLVNSAVASEGKGREYAHAGSAQCGSGMGSCRFMKTGGGGKLYQAGKHCGKIDGGTLPLGAFGHAQPRPAECQLMDGDYIIMLSDGMTEGWARRGRGGEAGNAAWLHRLRFTGGKSPIR